MGDCKRYEGKMFSLGKEKVEGGKKETHEMESTE